MILLLHLLVLMGSKWEYHFLVLIGSICLWTHHCCRQHLLWIYSNQCRHLQRAGTHLRSEQNSYTNPLMHIEYKHIHRFAHPCTYTHTHKEHHLRSLTLADCQPLQTETRQHHRTLPPMTSVSMAPLRSVWRHRGSSLHFNLPSLLPPQLEHWGLEICLRTE